MDWQRYSNPVFTTPRGEQINIGEGPINLDVESPEWLMRFWVTAHHHPRRVGATMFPSKPKGYQRTASLLASYAANKATAMGLRLKGEIQRATVYENISENIYEDLPSYARW